MSQFPPNASTKPFPLICGNSFRVYEIPMETLVSFWVCYFLLFTLFIWSTPKACCFYNSSLIICLMCDRASSPSLWLLFKQQSATDLIPLYKFYSKFNNFSKITGILIEIALPLYTAEHLHLCNMNSSYPRAWNVTPFVQIIFYVLKIIWNLEISSKR